MISLTMFFSQSSYFSFAFNVIYRLVLSNVLYKNFFVFNFSTLKMLLYWALACMISDEKSEYVVIFSLVLFM
jgi:hypothetical protein